MWQKTFLSHGFIYLDNNNNNNKIRQKYFINFSIPGTIQDLLKNNNNNNNKHLIST